MATIYGFLSQVINWSGRPVGNGVDYPVREGCSKYDFTVEQIEQKKEKRTRMVSISLCVCACEICVCVVMRATLFDVMCACVCVYLCV